MAIQTELLICNLKKLFVKLQERSFNLYKENPSEMAASVAYERRGLYEASEMIIACFPFLKEELGLILKKYDDKEIKIEENIKSQKIKDY